MKYTIDDIDHDNNASDPFDEFFQTVLNDCTDFINWLCSIPPLSWLDALMRGFVGPRP